MPKFNEEDEEAFEKTYVGSKWVKTDSECTQASITLSH